MRYAFDVVLMENGSDVAWVAKSRALKNCLGVGDTPEEAISELEENEQAWLEMAKENGFAIPPVKPEKTTAYSGKLTLRISPREHERAAEMAARQGISLNQYINDAVVSYVNN